MAEAEVGTSLQLGDLLLGAKVDILAKLNDIHSRLKSIEELEARYEQEGPVQVNLQGNASTAAGTVVPIFIDLGGPTFGRVWEVRQLAIGGLTWATTAGGTAQIQVASVVQNAAAPVGTLQDVAGSLPEIAFYSAGQFRVVYPNHIFVVIVGGTAATQYTAGGDALDLPDRPTRAVVGQ